MPIPLDFTAVRGRAVVCVAVSAAMAAILALTPSALAAEDAIPAPRGVGQIHRIFPVFVNDVVSGQTYLGVIFSPVSAPDLVLALYGLEDNEGYWQPRPSHVRSLEAALPDYLEAEAPQLAERVAAERYVRQYAGIVRGGQPLILVNASCEQFGADWLSEPIAIADGGDCFFQATYDPVAGTFSDLSINGEA